MLRHQSVVSDSPPATPKGLRWVMLNEQCRRMDDSFVANNKTVSDCRTFTGQHLCVSLRGAAPPATSFLHYDWTTDSVTTEDTVGNDYEDITVDVVAAHMDSVLLRMGNQRCPSEAFEDYNYFVYRAGSAGPPSLSLLPDRDFLTKTESVYSHRPRMYCGSTGLLRRGENDLRIIQLDLWYNRDAQQKMVEFCVFHPSTNKCQWELMEPVPILQRDHEVVRRLSGNAVVPVGDRYLCWVDYENGFHLCDMANEASPKVRYVPVPAEVRRCCNSSDYTPDYDIHGDDVFRVKYSMKMGSAGASKLRFVSMSPHCCSGGPGRSTCAHSRFTFTITTWKMDLSIDVESPLTWVKDGELDCEEVWTLPGYEGLPRANLKCPIMSLDDPNVISFLVSNHYFVDTYEDQKVWMIEINMKTKTLLSVVQVTDDPWRAYDHLPAQLQC